MDLEYCDKTAKIQKEYLEKVYTICAAQIKDMKVSAEGGRPFTCVDLGAADGINTIPLFEKVVPEVRKKDKERAIQLVYEDGPWNNFALICALDPYKFGPNTYQLACNKGFFDATMPPGSVDLEFTSHSTHYLTETPCMIKEGGIHMVMASESEKALFAKQAAKDWEKMLLARAVELAPGGRFVLSNLVIDDKGQYIYGTDYGKRFYPEISDCMRDMVKEGRITAKEFEMATSPEYFRTMAECRAPFEDPTSAVSKAGLILKSAEVLHTRCPHRQDWLAGKFSSAEAYGKHLAWVTTAFSRHKVARAFLYPENTRSEEEQTKLVDEMYERFAKRVAADPLIYGLDNISAVMIVEKKAAPVSCMSGLSKLFGK